MDVTDEVLIARVNGSKDHYEALHIGWEAKAEQIKKAYRQVSFLRIRIELLQNIIRDSPLAAIVLQQIGCTTWKT